MAEINTVIAEASQDLQTIEDFVNLPADSEVYPRLLPSVNVGTLAGARQAIFEAGGLPATPFETKALMTASALVDGDYAQVTDDTVNNGLYVKTEGVWVKSAYDPSVQAKEFSKNTVTTVAPKIQNHGYYTGASSSNVITGTTTAFGFEALQSGKISGFKTHLAGGAATLSFQVYRPLHKNLELISTQDISVAYPDSTVNFSNPIEVEKGDIVALRYLSGAYVRGLVVAVGELLGSYTVIAGTNVGEITTLGRSRNKPEFTFDIIYSELTNKTTDTSLLDSLALNAGELKDKSLSVSGEFFTDTTTTGSLTYAYGVLTAVAAFSQLEQIKYKARVTSTNARFTLAIIVKQNDSFVVSDLIPVSAPADADGIVIATKDHFGEAFVPSGGHVMVLGATSADAVLGKTGNTAGWHYVAAASLDVGATVNVLFGTSNQLSLEITFSAIENNLDYRVATLESNTLKPAPLRHSKELIKEQFLGAVLPSGWSETGGWTVNNGLKSPSTGGWTTTAVQANASAMAKRVYRCKFLVADVASIFGLCTTPIEASSGSAVAMIDGLQNKLIIYLWDGTNAGTSVAEVTIPTLVANRDYYLQVEKNGWYSTVTLTDTITQQSTTLEYRANAPYVQFHGQGGVIFISGDVTAKFFSFNALYPEKPHSIILGDSNSERAANVFPNETWAFKYADMRAMNADVIVAGRSGDETPNFLKRKNFDLLEWQPKYVVWALGTNDTSQATWRTNMAQNIADTVALGAEPILVTQIPRTNSQALRTAMNDDIRNGYFGNYRYVDFAKAVSLNNDGVTWDESYNSGDGTHVNPAGQIKLLVQLLTDIPDLLY